MESKKSAYKKFRESLDEAKNDPQFSKEIEKFIKITTGVYKLKDYGLDN